MTEFIVYGIPGSPYLRAVEVAMREKDAPYRFQAIALHEMKGEMHMKLHPFGRIPAVQHGDFHLYETQAILRYIDDLYPEPALEPSDPRAVARMNQIIGINDWYFFPKVAAQIVFQRIIGPALLGLKTDDAVIAAALPEGERCIAEFERLLGAQEFLAGTALSLADIMLAPQLDLFAATPEGAKLMAGTRLSAWLNRMRERPSMIASRPPFSTRPAV